MMSAPFIIMISPSYTHQNHPVNRADKGNRTPERRNKMLLTKSLLTHHVVFSILVLNYLSIIPEGALQKIPIYTIGYGNRSIEEFVELLQRYEIKFLVDIRSQPHSRFKPEFSRDALEKRLKQHHIRYISMGDALGGRPKDPSCYVDDRVDYARVREKPFYQKGISYLHTAWEKQLHVALMCSEAKPQECHRSKLIGNTLIEQDIEVMHIDEAGEIKTQQEINQILTHGQLPLFDQEPLTTLSEKIGLSRKRYPFPLVFVK